MGYNFQSRIDSMSVKEIFPSELRKTLPPLNSQEGVRDPIVHLKFRTTDSSWIWYVTEGSPEGDDFIFSDSSWGWKMNGDSSHFPNWLKLAVPLDVRSN